MTVSMRSVVAVLMVCAVAYPQDTFGGALQRGREMYAEKNFKDALDAFQTAFSRAQSAKESAQACARIGETLGELGRTREGIEYMQRSLDFYHYDQVEGELKELRARHLSKVQTSEEIRSALRDQQASNRGTRVMPRRPLILRINFDFDQATLTQEGHEQVANLGKALAGFTDERILIVGHTDLIGQPGYNQTLSERRAATVATEIATRHGVSQFKMLTKGMGMRQPLYDGKSDEDSKLNRRVEVTLVKPGENPAP